MSLQVMPSSGGPEASTTVFEKFLRYLPIILVGAGVFYFWGTIVPFVEETLKHTLRAAIYAAILLIVGGFVWNYSSFILMTYHSVCKWVASFFIKMDPLSYMDRYADILSAKWKNLNKGIVSIKAELITANNEMEADKKTVEDNVKLGTAAKEMGKTQQAASFGLEARNAQESINLALPGKLRLERSLEFMQAMSENWEYSIKGIRSFNARKRKDYIRLKRNAKILKNSQEFLRGETPEAQIYLESVKVAEEQMSNWLAFANDFEERAKPILEGAEIDKTVRTNEGLAMLEEFKSKLMLPDFNNLPATYTSKLDAEAIPYEESKFNLLNKSSNV